MSAATSGILAIALSRPRIALGATLVAISGALALAPGAGATTFCVPAFSVTCPDNGTNVAQVNLETAATTNGSDGVADTIRVAPGFTHTDADSLMPSGTDDLVVVGGGPSTVLTSSSSGNIFIVNLLPRSGKTELRDLTIKLPASLPNGLGAGLQVGSDSLEAVRFVTDNPGSDAIPSIVGGADLENVSVLDTGAAHFGYAIRTDSNMTGTVNIRGGDFRGVTTGASNGGSGTIDISHSRIELDGATGQVGVVQASGSNVVSNSVIETPKGVPFYTSSSSTDASLDVDGVTMYDTNPAVTTPVAVNANGAGNASATMTGSIAYGFNEAFVRGAAGPGHADVDISYSNTPQVASSSIGPGAGAITHGFAADPLFTAAVSGDFTLQAGSPSIDAADPASALTTDLLGDARPVDGDGDSNAVADQGAFEYQLPPDNTAPATKIDSGPGPKARKGKPRFSFSADEKATFECSLVKKGKKPRYSMCNSPKSYKIKRGRKATKYSFSVRATDPADNVDATPAKKTFKVKKKEDKRRKRAD